MSEKFNQILKLVLLLTMDYGLWTMDCLSGYTQLGYSNFGDAVSGFSARSVGMGSTGITTINDASALAVNPATLMDITANKMLVSVTPSYILFEEEERLIDPQNMYNENGKLNIQNIKNAPVFFEVCGTGVALPVLRDRFIVGINYSPVLNMSYKHSEKITDGLANIYENNYNSSGGINKTSVGFGLKIIDELSIGFSYGFLTGKSKVKTESTLVAVGSQSKDDISAKYAGGSVHYGLVFNQLNYTLGGFYQSSAIIDSDITDTDAIVLKKTVYENEFKYPEKFGLGFSYRLKGKFRTLFAVDWERQNWNVLTEVTKKINGVDTNNKRYHPDGYEKTDEIKLGLEMWLNDFIPVRGGFRYQEFYYNWDNTVYNWYHSSYITKNVVPAFYCFSFGTGYVLDKFDFDIGYEFGKRNYEVSVLERYDEYLQRFLLTTRVRW